MSKIGRNAPCLCGSGKKYKHCCLAEAERHAYTSTDREQTLMHLQEHLGGDLAPLMEALKSDFKLVEPDPSLDLDEELLARMLSRDVFESWALYDVSLKEGMRVVDVVLLSDDSLSPGGRTFLACMGNSTMRLYEVMDVRPGATLTLRDLVLGGDRTVYSPRAASSMPPGTLLAGRIVSPGPSGLPELDGGSLVLPEDWRDELTAELRADLEQFRSEHPGEPDDEFFKRRPPWFHDQWRQLVEHPDGPEEIVVEASEPPASASDQRP